MIQVDVKLFMVNIHTYIYVECTLVMLVSLFVNVKFYPAIFFLIWTKIYIRCINIMASASSTSAKNLFQDSKQKLSERVQVHTEPVL